VFYVIILVGSYFFNRAMFWRWLTWGSGIIILIIAGYAGWMMLQTKLSKWRLSKILERVKKSGLEQEVKNFIARFGQENKSNRNVWTYRNYRFDWGRIKDFEQHAEEKGFALSHEDFGILLRHHIDEREYALTTESVLTDSNSFGDLTGSQFENLLKRLFEAMGYQVQLIGSVGDQGGDLIANQAGKRFLIQAKRYSGSVGNSAIQEAVAAKNHYDCSSAVVVTTGEFTREAVALAKTNSVQLVGKVELQQKLMEHLKENWR